MVVVSTLSYPLHLEQLSRKWTRTGRRVRTNTNDLNSMRRRKARRVILAEALATIEENKRRMKEMNLEHALNREGSMAGSMAGSSYSGRSYNGGMGGMGGMAGIGGMSRGDSMPMQTFSQSQMPPPVYDGKRGMEAFSGGKI